MIKHTFLTLLAAAAFIPYCGAVPVPAEITRIISEPPPRVIKIGKKGIHPLCVNGNVRMEIVVPADASPSARYAGKMMAEKFSQAFGAAVPVVTAPTGNKTAVIMGNSAEARKAGIDVKKLPRDGFIIKSVGKNIIIAGLDDPKTDPARAFGWALFFERGTLNGALEFMERFGGMAFYFPGELGEVIPRQKNLVLPELNIFDRPDKPRRRFLVGGWANWFPGNPMSHRFGEAWLNLVYRTESFYVPNCHSLERLKFVERFGKTNPEFFAMDHNGRRMLDPGSPYYGNLCYTDPGFRNALFQDAVAFLKNLPPKSRNLKGWDPSCLQKGFFNVMPKDHFRPCLCKNCRAFVKKHSEADLVWDLAFDMAERIKKAALPGYVTAMSYAHYTEVPKRKLPDNLLIMCAVQGPWAENNAPRRKILEERLKVWNKALGHKVWSWTYTGKYGGLDIKNVPSTTPRIVAKYFNRTKDLTTGSFLEAESDHWIFSYLMIHTFGKIMWDSARDPDALVDTHHKKMFGKAAPAMKKFFDRIESIWLNHISGRIVETNLGPQAMPPSEYELWEKIYNKAQLEYLDKCFAEAEKAAAKEDKIILKRIRYFRSNFLGLIVKEREKYYNTRVNVGEWYSFAVPAEKMPVIDGKEDDPVWKNAPKNYLLPWMKDFTEVHTWFKAAQDKNNIYFFVRCDEPDMKGIIADQKGPDNNDIWRDSDVEFFLNGSGDRQSYGQIMVNSNGETYDAWCSVKGSSAIHDPKWDSKAELRTFKGKDYWTVEIRFPLSQLGKIDPAKFAANVSRHRAIRSKAKVPYYKWSPYAKNFHDVANYGVLRFAKVDKGGNLVDNSDFSAPQRGRAFGTWYTDEDEIKRNIVTLDKTQFVKGGRSIKINSDGKKIYWVTHYMPSLKPNRNYEVTWFVRTENLKPTGKGYQGRGGASFVYGTGGKQFFFPHNHYQNSMPWTPQRLTFRSEPNTGKKPSFLRLGVLHATGTVWFDDIRVRELPEKK
ncbi:MAG: DUF4838 domain-containing protein [Lentisphaeria bacterium]|nr:DUF4838 domain-containing protein [Lentisphaeria bacterium]